MPIKAPSRPAIPLMMAPRLIVDIVSDWVAGLLASTARCQVTSSSRARVRLAPGSAGALQ